MIMNSVLTVLRLSLFILRHLQILENAGTRFSFISSSFLKSISKPVSSANVVISTYGMYKGIDMNNKGPVMDPWRTLKH